MNKFTRKITDLSESQLPLKETIEESTIIHDKVDEIEQSKKDSQNALREGGLI